MAVNGDFNTTQAALTGKSVNDKNKTAVTNNRFTDSLFGRAAPWSYRGDKRMAGHAGGDGEETGQPDAPDGEEGGDGSVLVL